MWLLYRCCALLLVLLGQSISVTARITDDVIERDGRGIILLAEPFGFGSEGHLDLTVSNLELHRSNVDTNLQGFFITSSQVSYQISFVMHSTSSPACCHSQGHSDHILCKHPACSTSQQSALCLGTFARLLVLVVYLDILRHGVALPAFLASN